MHGTVYGNVTLQDDFTINEGETLTIGQGTSLTVPDDKTLTNNGTVTTENGGSLTNNGTINNNNGTVTTEEGDSLTNEGTINNINGILPETINGNTPPSISVQPQNKEVTAGKEATFSVTANSNDDKLTYQ